MRTFNLRDEVIYKHHKGIIVFVDDSYIVIKGQSAPGRDYPHLVVFPEDWKRVIELRTHRNDYGN